LSLEGGGLASAAVAQAGTLRVALRVGKRGLAIGMPIAARVPAHRRLLAIFTCKFESFAYRERIVATRAGSAPRARFFATAAKGTESLLCEELRELGLPYVTADRGGVRFGSASEDAYQACLWSRIALRIHEPLRTFECRNADELYAGVKSIDWSQYLGGEQTLAVRAAGRGDQLTHTHFIAVRAKDAIVDQLRESRGSRPSVDRESPDVLLFVHLARDRASVNLDYSGGSLHEHGFRSREGVAPIRETLAAALVRFSGWQGESALVDPMCGSGTLLLEAGLWAGRRAPGLTRERFGFERWSCFDASAARSLAALREAARAAERAIPPLYGSDSDPKAIEQTLANAAAAGVKIELQKLAFSRVTPRPGAGALLCNPPYGQRLERPLELERDLDALLERFAPYQRALIVPAGFGSRLRATRWQAVFNGPIECELRRYDAEGRRLSFRSPSGAAPAGG
jgi:23S rRNA G2445 N2-methylase RlmL